MSNVDLRQGEFMELVAPRVRRIARFRFAGIHKYDLRAEMTQEALARAWRSWRNTVRRGEDPAPWAQLIARHACQEAQAGQRMGRDTHGRCPIARAEQVHSKIARYQLSDEGILDPDTGAAEALAGRCGAESWQVAVCTVDWPAFVEQLPERQRRVVHLLAGGKKQCEAARALGVHFQVVSRDVGRILERWSRWCQ